MSNWQDRASSLQNDITRATAPELDGADWALNMAICDHIPREAHGPSDAATALIQRLGHTNPRVVLLALVLTEAVVKNCGAESQKEVANPAFLSHIEAIAQGRSGPRAAKKALDLVQSWALGFASRMDELPAFHDTYSKLRMTGAEFQATHEGLGVATFDDSVSLRDAFPRTSNLIQNQSTYQPPPPPPPSAQTTQAADEAKLGRDLDVVQQQLELCGDMVNTMLDSGDTEPADVLLDIVDFLDQCRGRLKALIEVGMTAGASDSRDTAITEGVLARVFSMHDLIVSTLEDFDALEAQGFKSSIRLRVGSAAAAAALAAQVDEKINSFNEAIAAAASVDIPDDTPVEVAIRAGANAAAVAAPSSPSAPPPQHEEDTLVIPDESTSVVANPYVQFAHGSSHNEAPPAYSSLVGDTVKNTSSSTLLSAADTTALFEAEEGDDVDMPFVDMDEEANSIFPR